MIIHLFQLYGIILLMALALVVSATADFLKRLFRLVVLLVRMWLPKALERMILPFPVVLKRLAAPLRVFILGMTILSLTLHFGRFRKKPTVPPFAGELLVIPSFWCWL
jgi:hypothetical protein